jgi:hypothetical protein
MKQVAVAAVIAVLIAGGAVRIYSYTSPLSNNSTSLGTASQSAATACGSQVSPFEGQSSSYQPVGCWAGYMGFLPAGYVPAPHFPNAAVYQCPSGMDANQCRQFEASCGNGICDPNETCSDCPIDCDNGGNVGQLVCDQWTGRADESPLASDVCQVNENTIAG